MTRTSVCFLLTLTFLYVDSFRTPTRRGRSFPNFLDTASPGGFHRRNQDDLAKKYANGFLLFDSKGKGKMPIYLYSFNCMNTNCLNIFKRMPKVEN